jgi:hypothetical protein
MPACCRAGTGATIRPESRQEQERAREDHHPLGVAVRDDEEIAAPMTAAAMLSTPHRPGTLWTIGVLAATGMRVGEAIRLDRSDVDFAGRTVGHARRQARRSRELALNRRHLQAQHPRRDRRQHRLGGAHRGHGERRARQGRRRHVLKFGHSRTRYCRSVAVRSSPTSAAIRAEQAPTVSGRARSNRPRCASTIGTEPLDGHF